MESLDVAILDYLRYRNFHASADLFETERSSTTTHFVDKVEKEATIGRLMNAILGSDYAKTLLLWDSCIIQHLDEKSKELQMESLIVEFNVHLYCTSYVFRSETVKNYKSPTEIAKIAARAMTIFKHYAETRGSKVIELEEYERYKTLHKIAFPPTHPQFSHLFKSEWMEKTKVRIIAFLHQFYDLDVTTPPPPLLQMYSDRNLMAKEMKSTFKRRERKLMQFARSIFDVANGLISKLEEDAKKEEFDSILNLEKEHSVSVRSGGMAQHLLEAKEKLQDFQSVLDPSLVSLSVEPSPARKGNAESLLSKSPNPVVAPPASSNDMSNSGSNNSPDVSPVKESAVAHTNTNIDSKPTVPDYKPPQDIENDTMGVAAGAGEESNNNAAAVPGFGSSLGDSNSGDSDTEVPQPVESVSKEENFGNGKEGELAANSEEDIHGTESEMKENSENVEESRVLSRGTAGDPGMDLCIVGNTVTNQNSSANSRPVSTQNPSGEPEEGGKEYPQVLSF